MSDGTVRVIGVLLIVVMYVAWEIVPFLVDNYLSHEQELADPLDSYEQERNHYE